MSFMQRMMHYIINQVLVDGLANSRWFQRFAIRSNQFFSEAGKKGLEAKGEAAAKGSEFWKVFREEVTKGMRDLQQKPPPK